MLCNLVMGLQFASHALYTLFKIKKERKKITASGGRFSPCRDRGQRRASAIWISEYNWISSEGKINWPQKKQTTVFPSSQKMSWRSAPTRESYTTTIPTYSNSVSPPQTLSFSLYISSENPHHQTCSIYKQPNYIFKQKKKSLFSPQKWKKKK